MLRMCKIRCAIKEILQRLWSDKEPIFNNLMPIGPCWVHINGDSQKKIDPRAVKGVLLGYYDFRTY